MVEEVPVELADQAVVEVLQVEGSNEMDPRGVVKVERRCIEEDRTD